jgi:hypothetical protein
MTTCGTDSVLSDHQVLDDDQAIYRVDVQNTPTDRKVGELTDRRGLVLPVAAIESTRIPLEPPGPRGLDRAEPTDSDVVCGKR